MFCYDNCCLPLGCSWHGWVGGPPILLHLRFFLSSSTRNSLLCNLWWQTHYELSLFWQDWFVHAASSISVLRQTFQSIFIYKGPVGTTLPGFELSSFLWPSHSGPAPTWAASSAIFPVETAKSPRRATNNNRITKILLNYNKYTK